MPGDQVPSWTCLFGHGKKYLTDATGFVDKLVGGWGVDGITIFQTGFPLAFSHAIPNYTASFGGGARPKVVRNKSSGLDGSAKLGERFNTACFTAPADFTYGDEFRTDPTMFGTDDRLGIAFRAEFFNLFNRNQGARNTSVGSSTFGQVSSIHPGTNPRLIQFGLKFLF